MATIHFVADTENNVPKDNLFADSENGAEEADFDYDYFDTAALRDSINAWGAPDESENDTRVWAWGLAEASPDATEDDVQVGPDLDSFFKTVRTLKGGAIVVWFHNLAYDGHLLVSHLLKAGYTHSFESASGTPENAESARLNGRAPRKPRPGTFVTTLSDQGAWYSIKVTFHHGNRTVEFRDSLKILPFSVDAISHALKTRAKKLTGTIDYQKTRPYGYVMTDKEKAYVVNDVLVMAEAVGMLKADESQVLDSLTIGSACMKQYHTSLGEGDRKTGKDTFRMIFPALDPETDAELRPSYSGGYCYVKASNDIIDLRGTGTTGSVYDVNSLYPSVMYKHRYPCGEPISTDPSLFDTYKGSWEYIVRIKVDFTVKPDHIPFIQVKNSIWRDNEHLRSSDGIITQTFTRPGFELFLEQYDVSYMEIDAFWRFDHIDNAFDDYIEHWYSVKNNAKNPVERLRAKLMLNNLYGKMAQGLVRNGLEPWMDEDGVVRFDLRDGEAEGGYIPAGAYITAYAKAVMVRAAQANYENFLYCDTDSYHGIGTPVGIPIGEGLGEWDFEGEWDMARYVRQKTYIERLVGAGGRPLDTPKIDIKAAGAPAEVKARLCYKVTDRADGQWVHHRITRDPDTDEVLDERRPDEEIFERFTFGVVEAGKLRRASVNGGPILIPTTFKIHPLPGMTEDPVTGLCP